MATTVVQCPACNVRNRLAKDAAGRPRCSKCHADLPWLVEAGADEFDRVIERSKLPVLVDLWAPWCGPCRAVAPALEQLAVERAGSLRVVKVNVDQSPEVSARLGVQGIPTMVLFADGVEISRQVGALPADGIRRWVDGALVTLRRA
jgi:thioredoxin 2